MLQRRMLQTAFADLPLAFEFLLSLARARQSSAAPIPAGIEDCLELGAEDVVLAAQLAALLQPIATSLGGLFSNNKVVLIKAASYEEVLRSVDMLEAARDFAYSKDGLELPDMSGDRYPLVIATSNSGVRTSPDNALLEAYRTGALVLCLVSPGTEDNDMKSLTVAADVVAPLPGVTRDTAERVFLSAFGEVPSQMAECSDFEKLDATTLGSIVRPTRPIDACVAALLGVLRPTGPYAISEGNYNVESAATAGFGLKGAFGYGLANDWAANLASDHALWRSGKLDWSEVADRALLLSGPPGIGKSTFPRLFAQSIGVPLTESSVAEWNSHRNLSGTLAQMKSVFASARETKGILFIDEVDGIGRRDRADETYRDYWAQIVNQLLTLVSELLATPGLVLIGATNYPDRIDPALLRSGRIDRHIHLELPDAAARAGIIRQYAKIALSDDQLGQLAEMTEGSSGADLQRLVRNASASARRHGAMLSFDKILLEIARPLQEMGPDDRHRIHVYRQGQSLVAETLGTKLGGGPDYPTLDALRDQLTILLAGRVAEKIMLGQASVLGEADLAGARKIAEAIEGRWGLGALGLGVGTPRSGRPPVGQHLDTAALRAGRLLSDNLAELQRRCSTDLVRPAAPRRPVAPSTLH